MAKEKLIDREDWTEHYVRKGNPKKPTYYIIRRKLDFVGLFSNYIVFASHIRHALSKGWLPVIDMQNYPNAYLEPEKLGKENAWEYFFEQPLRIGLEEAYNGENIILANGDAVWFPWQDMTIYENKTVLTEWRMLVKWGLLRIKPQLMESILAVKDELFPKNRRVLGVFLRGTDYIANRPYGHPIPPPIEYAMGVVLSKLQEWQYTRIFLSTEDKDILQVFKSLFKDVCFTIDREYADCKPGQIYVNSRINRENDRFLTAKDYLTELVLLSQCNSFITARSSGSLGVMMMANDFEHVLAFNLGNYGKLAPI